MFCFCFVCVNMFFFSHSSDDGRHQEQAAAAVAREQKLTRGTQQNVETIGPTNKENTTHPAPGAAGSYGGNLTNFHLYFDFS